MNAGISLPLDAVRKVFKCLDWCSLCSCSRVCSTWHALACEDAVWQQQLAAEYYRPSMLQHYSLLKCSNAKQKLAALQEAHGSAAAAAPSKLKQLFAQHKETPAAQHQALLARFHTAMQDITAWRLLIRMVPPDAQAPAPAAAAAAVEPGMQQLANTSISSCSSSSNSSSSSSNSGGRTIRGHPAALTLAAVEAGGWCCGCVLQQQQEQSCWVHFNLPAALKDDQQLAAAAAAGQLGAVVQAMGPTGWFDVAVCSPFAIADDDIDILLQSHKSGFYAWDQADEDGPDRHGDAEPLPWDLTPPASRQQNQQNQQQQPLQQQQQQQQVCQQHCEQENAVKTMQQQQQQQQMPAPSSQDQPGAQQASSAGQQQQQGRQSKLRMLVYIHYEQLLQTLPWQLPQSLPVPERLHLQNLAAAGQHLAAAAALWVHIDVCQLHGGLRLGSCTAPLRSAKMGPEGVSFEAQGKCVLVAMYDPASSMNSSCGAAAGSSAGAAVVAGAAAGSGGCASGFAGQQRLQQGGVLLDDACEVLLLGDQCIGGSSSGGGGGSRTDRHGLVVGRAADVLQDLLSRDEVMVDFSLFDGQGRLLMGRAGVEVWSREFVSWHTPTANQQVQEPDLEQMQQQQQPHQAAEDPELQQEQHGADVNEQQLEQALEQQLGLEQQQQEHDQAPLIGEAAEHAAAAAAGHAGAPIMHTRTLHMLHFLVDGVESSLWDNGIAVDAETPPAGVAVPLLSMRLTWSAIRGLFVGRQGAVGASGSSGQQAACAGSASIDNAIGEFDVGDAMQAMMGAM